jgi:hypothetical protein
MVRVELVEISNVPLSNELATKSPQMESMVVVFSEHPDELQCNTPLGIVGKLPSIVVPLQLKTPSEEGNVGNDIVVPTLEKLIVSRVLGNEYDPDQEQYNPFKIFKVEDGASDIVVNKEFEEHFNSVTVAGIVGKTVKLFDEQSNVISDGGSSGNGPKRELNEQSKYVNDCGRYGKVLSPNARLVVTASKRSNEDKFHKYLMDDIGCPERYNSVMSTEAVWLNPLNVSVNGPPADDENVNNKAELVVNVNVVGSSAEIEKVSPVP